MTDRLSDSGAVIEALRHEKAALQRQVTEERRKTTEVEAKCNRLAIDNAQLIRQHNQDAADVESKKHENLRLRNHITILEAKLHDAGAERR